MADHLGPSRTKLRWLTVWGPLLFLAFLVALHFALHPKIPVALRAMIVLGLGLTGGVTFLFSRFVFGHIQRQEAELLRRTRELAEANEAMAIVKERQRIARDLHDSVAQSLGYLHLQLAAAEQRMAAGDAAGVARELPELRRVAREAYEEARQAIFGLRGMVTRGLGLVPTLAEYLEDWSRQTGVQVELRLSPRDGLSVPPVIEVQLIGIIQEAMANVRKHARAGRVTVRLVPNDDGFAQLSIADDGVGFDPPAVGARGERTFGLDTMRERAETVGAKLVVTSAPGRGTTVEVDFPVQAPGPRR